MQRSWQSALLAEPSSFGTGLALFLYKVRGQKPAGLGQAGDGGGGGMGWTDMLTALQCVHRSEGSKGSQNKTT